MQIFFVKLLLTIMLIYKEIKDMLIFAKSFCIYKQIKIKIIFSYNIYENILFVF